MSGTGYHLAGEGRTETEPASLRQACLFLVLGEKKSVAFTGQLHTNAMFGASWDEFHLKKGWDRALAEHQMCLVGRHSRGSGHALPHASGCELPLVIGTDFLEFVPKMGKRWQLLTPRKHPPFSATTWFQARQTEQNQTEDLGCDAVGLIDDGISQCWEVSWPVSCLRTWKVKFEMPHGAGPIVRAKRANEPFPFPFSRYPKQGEMREEGELHGPAIAFCQICLIYSVQCRTHTARVQGE
jgi:hypothetical protein